MSTIPSLSETLNNEFIETWYEVRPDAIDNILEARVVTALMKEKGVFKPQVGGRFITETIKYGKKTAAGFEKGDVLPLGDPETETVAMWNFKNIQANLTRSFEEDSINQGEYKRKDYVERKLVEARDALSDIIEDTYLREEIYDTADADMSKLPFSIFDYIPNLAGTDYTAGTTTWGGIRRSNAYWQHHDWTDTSSASSRGHDPKAGPKALTMYEDMTNAYNTIGAQKDNPDMIITTQALFEVYDSFASAREQLIRDETTNLANLGFDVLKFRGKALVWSDNMTANEMLMMNSKYYKTVFDPTSWFEMTSWERPARQLEQVAYIILRMQNIGFNPRYNGRILWSS